MIHLHMRDNEVRFPRHEGSLSSPVITYRLSPEELSMIHAKYGPPNKNKGKKKNTWSDLFYEKTSRTGKKGNQS